MNYEPLFDRPFNASRHKIKRARKHIADLDGLTAQHLAENPPVSTVVPPEKLGPGQLFAWQTTFKGPSDDYGATFGDAVHNMRSALDLMAIDLVRAQNGNHKSVYFPFASNKGDLDKQITSKNFHRTGKEAVALLKKWAPYTGGNAALRAIHDFDVADKHVCMTPSGIMFNSPLMKVDMTPEGRTILVPVEGSNAPTDTKLVFPVGYPFANEEIVPTLHKLADLVESVVEAFEALCEVAGIDLNAVRRHFGSQPLAGGGKIELVNRTDPNGTPIPPLGIVVQSTSS